MGHCSWCNLLEQATDCLLSSLPHTFSYTPTLAPTPASPLQTLRYDTLPPNDAHLQRIADHVSAYLQIVRSQLLATVPKAIVHCMVRGGKGWTGARGQGGEVGVSEAI